MTFDLEEECYICYAFWVPYEVYIKDFSKFHCFPPVLSSWWSSIHLLELKIQMWKIPPCHTSKVASWHVHSGYELHLWSYLSKIWLKVSKTCDISCFLQYCQFLQLLIFDKGGILHIWIFNPRGWIEDHQEDRTGGKQWNFEKSFIYTS